jgi:inorganic pyrophosphatase/exopolyphosphatase
MRIITSGGRFLDIDGYAGCIAFAELLQKQGVEAKAVSTAPLNESIPAIVREWHGKIETTYSPSADDTYSLIDVSNPDYFESFVDLGRIDEVIDHHPGLEDYWQHRIGKGSTIEHVGAACTQVFERWEKAGLADQISQTSARLLMCGILDNTLNFGADITTSRDKHAYDVLNRYANLPMDWVAQYFGACQESVTEDIARTVINDTKVLDFRTYPKTIALGQFAVWDAEEAVRESLVLFESTLASVEAHWFMNAIGIGNKKSYFVTNIPEVKGWLTDLLGVAFEQDIAIANRMWLRKEIMKADIDRETC